MKYAHCKRSFTLIELLIVLVIIGILATLALPQYEAFVWKARFAEVYTIVGMVSRAEEAYKIETGNYTQFEEPECYAGHSSPANGYDGHITKVQKALGITVPSGCIFTYLIYPSDVYPSIFRIYFKLPGYEWAWVYKYKERVWYDYGVNDGGPARKYFKPPT